MVRACNILHMTFEAIDSSHLQAPGKWGEKEKKKAPIREPAFNYEVHKEAEIGADVMNSLRDAHDRIHAWVCGCSWLPWLSHPNARPGPKDPGPSPATVRREQ